MDDDTGFGSLRFNDETGEWYSVGSDTPIDAQGNPINPGDASPVGVGSAGWLKGISEWLSGKGPLGPAGQLAGLAGIAALLNKVSGGSGGGFSSYQGGVPEYVATRTQTPAAMQRPTTTSPTGETVPYRPGQGGITYFTPMQYAYTGQDIGKPKSIGVPSMSTTPTTPTVPTTPSDKIDTGSGSGVIPPDYSLVPESGQFGGAGAKPLDSQVARPYVADDYFTGGSSFTPAPTTPTAPTSLPDLSGLTSGQRLYAQHLFTQQGQGSPNEIMDYVRGLNDYQSLASLAGMQGKYGDIRSPSGYEEMQKLGTMYGVPDLSYGGGLNYAVSKSSTPYAPDKVNTDYGTPLFQSTYSAPYAPDKPIAQAASGGYFQPTVAAAAGGRMPGGISSLAGGGGRFLRGPGDGVSDSIHASINGDRPARLADGEFVIDARTVSEIGNGSSEAGARKLYEMMDRVHSARKKAARGKPSNADKYLPK